MQVEPLFPEPLWLIVNPGTVLAVLLTKVLLMLRLKLEAEPGLLSEVEILLRADDNGSETGVVPVDEA